MTSRDIPLSTPDGAVASLADLAGPTLVVQLVRYFGCLPCQVYLRAMDGRADELSAVGVRPLAIGGSAAHQARWLRDTGVSMPLLLVPQQQFRAWVGLGDLSARQMLSPAGLRRYAAAALSGVPNRRPTEDVMRAPGIAILDADLVLRWSYEGSSLGDYPPLDTVLRHARALGP